MIPSLSAVYKMWLKRPGSSGAVTSLYSLFLPPPASTVKISNQEAIPRKNILMGQIYAAASGELGADRYEKFKLNQYFVLYQITVR